MNFNLFFTLLSAIFLSRVLSPIFCFLLALLTMAAQAAIWVINAVRP